MKNNTRKIITTIMLAVGNATMLVMFLLDNFIGLGMWGKAVLAGLGLGLIVGALIWEAVVLIKDRSKDNEL